MKVFYLHTQSPNGGFGVLGKGIRAALEKLPGVELVEDNPDVVFTYGMPELIDTAKRRFGKKPKYVHYFVWESSELPKSFANTYRKVDLLLTAARYTQRVAQKAGLKAYIWHHAVDDRFQYRKPLNDGIFTFLHHNAYEYRKGWEILLKAFTEEFALDEPVRLLMKARERKESVWLVPKKGAMTLEESLKMKNDRKAYLAEDLKIDHPLIEEIIGHVSDEEMVNINARADVYVAPAKGEGWFLPPFEAAAMGIVPMIPNQSCMREWFNPECMIDIKVAGYIPTSPRYPGYMYYCSVRDLRKKLRWAFNNQEKIKEMGKLASEYIHREYNWTKVANEWYDIVSAKLSL